MFLHSGRPVPSYDVQCIRNEGVGIFLDEKATTTCKTGRVLWSAVSSCIITARLKVGGNGIGLQDRGSLSAGFVSVISVYALPSGQQHEQQSHFMNN